MVDLSKLKEDVERSRQELAEKESILRHYQGTIEARQAIIDFKSAFNKLTFSETNPEALERDIEHTKALLTKLSGVLQPAPAPRERRTARQGARGARPKSAITRLLRKGPLASREILAHLEDYMSKNGLEESSIKAALDEQLAVGKLKYNAGKYALGKV